MNRVNKLLIIMESPFSKQVQKKIEILNKHSIILLNKSKKKYWPYKIQIQRKAQKYLMVVRLRKRIKSNVVDQIKYNIS
jgi:hypothetical protein